MDTSVFAGFIGPVESALSTDLNDNILKSICGHIKTLVATEKGKRIGAGETGPKMTDAKQLGYASMLFEDCLAWLGAHPGHGMFVSIQKLFTTTVGAILAATPEYYQICHQ